MIKILENLGTNGDFQRESGAFGGTGRRLETRAFAASMRLFAA
jgi:hypothetical protein